MLESSALLALLSSFIIKLLAKTGRREWLQTFGPKNIAKAASCDFCISFWVNLILSVFFYIFVNTGIEVFVYPFIATPLTHKLL